MLNVDVKAHKAKNKAKASLKPKNRLLLWYSLQMALERVKLFTSITVRSNIEEILQGLP